MLYDTAIKDKWKFKNRKNNENIIWYDELVKNKGNGNCVDYAVNICYEAIMENFGCTLIRCGFDIYKPSGVKGYHHIMPVRWDQKEMIFENYVNDPKVNFKDIYKINSKPDFSIIKNNCVKKVQDFLPLLYFHAIPNNLKDYKNTKSLEIASPETAQMAILEYYNKRVSQERLLEKAFRNCYTKTL